MHVIKRALTEAAAKESSRAAGVTADSPGAPALSSDQAAGASTLHAATMNVCHFGSAALATKLLFYASQFLHVFQ